jgi:hypothetical protein
VTSGTNRFKGTAAIFLVATVVLLWVQSWMLHEARAHLIGVERDLRSAKAHTAALRVDLLAVLERFEPVPPGSLGRQVSADAASAKGIDLAANQLVYLLSTACGKCPANFPILGELERRHPGSVVAVSIADSAPALAEYVAKHELPFPAYALSEGWLYEMLPRHGTPVTILIRDGHLFDLASGLLTSEQAREFALHVVGR